MQTFKDIFKNNVVVFGMVIGMTTIVSSLILSQGISVINNKNTISVTGTAEHMVMSDQGKWTLMLVKQSTPEAYAFTSKSLQDAGNVVVKHLVSQGIDKEHVTVQPITQTVICQSQQQVMYDGNGRQQCSGPFSYSLSETIIVESDNVSKLKEIALASPTVLSSLGIQIQTVSLDFFYTQLHDIRATLLEEAAKNAKERAQAIAKSTGNRIGGVKDASQGVFQVTQRNSIDVSDYGNYDTQTIEKKVTAIVRASFEVK